MTEITFFPTISLDAVIASIIAVLALIAVVHLTCKQISIMDKQRQIFDRQTVISERMAFYQGQQTTISQQQANLLSQQLAFIRKQEKDRRNKEELFLLIAPLHTAFKKEYDIFDWISDRQTTKIWKHNDSPHKKEALTKLEEEIIEIIRQRKGYAHGPLYSKLDNLDGLLPNLMKNKEDILALLNELSMLVETRYAELTKN
jgi:hypothetical protein